MEFIYITNNEELALCAQSAGVERVMIDLEVNGKLERQGHLDTLISAHALADISVLRKSLNCSKLQVRVNPIYSGSQNEINEVIDRGADVVMLPMFKTSMEVEHFVDIVSGRAEVTLLLETPQALSRIDSILTVNGINEVHVGLNDLHLGMGLSFMFELLSGGLLEYLLNKIKKRGVRYGFGGISTLGSGVIPAELILSEHVRLGSNAVILSRGFHGAAQNINGLIDFDKELSRIRAYEFYLKSQDLSLLINNQEHLIKKINDYIKQKY